MLRRDIDILCVHCVGDLWGISWDSANWGTCRTTSRYTGIIIANLHDKMTYSACVVTGCIRVPSALFIACLKMARLGQNHMSHTKSERMDLQTSLSARYVFPTWFLLNKNNHCKTVGSLALVLTGIHFFVWHMVFDRTSTKVVYQAIIDQLNIMC